MKKTLLLICLLMSLFVTANAQTVVTIGTGTTSTNNYYPFSDYYNYNRSAALYTASEIGVMGQITDLGWNIGTANGAVSHPIKVYLKTVTATSLPASDTWANLISGATLVYDATELISPTGWKTLNITDFAYNSDNLLVLCESGSAPFTSPYPTFQFTTTSGTNTYLIAQADGSAPTSISPSTMKPNIRLTISTQTYTNDLGVTALTTSPASVWAGETVTINTTIKNNGTAEQTNKNVVIKIDGTTVSTQNIASLAAGATTNLSFDWTSTAGTHAVRVELPTGDEVAANDNREISVNIATPITSFPYTESFDGATFPPAYWANTQISGTYLWTRSTAGTSPTCSPHSGAGMASYPNQTGSATLVTPRLSLSGSSYKVKFWMYRNSEVSTEKIEVYANNTGDLSGSPVLLGTINRQNSLSPTVATNGWYEYGFDFNSTKSSKFIVFKAIATQSYYYNLFIDDVAIVENIPMVYSSSTTTQSNTNAVMTSTTNQQVIGIQVVASGALAPLLDLTKLIVNVNGTTNTADISNAKIYYSGTSSTFTTTTQFGTTVATPTTANFEISGTQTLAEGTNYFWLTYDISATATVGNVVDGECTGITISGTDYAPTITAPTGNRTIKAALGGILTINPDGSGSNNYTSFANAISDLQMLGVATGGVIFNVEKGKTFNENPITITVTGTLSNQIVFQTSGTGAKPIINFTGTAGSVDAGFKLAGSDYITFDGLDVRDAGVAAASYLEHGFYLDATGNVGCKNNTIKNCVVDLTRANTNSKGIRTYSNPTSADGSNDNNKFYNNTITDAFNGYYLECNTNSNNDDGNEIGVNSGTSSITNIGAAGAVVYGIYNKNQKNSKFFSSEITGGSGIDNKFYGIFTDGSGSTSQIYANNIHGWSTTINTSYSYMAGIYIADGTNTIYGNKVYSISTTISNTNSRMTGIYLASGTNTVYNNFVTEISAPSYTVGNGAVGVAGIYHAYGVANIYYNTVKLNYPSVSSSNVSAALYATSGVNVDVRNNIFINAVSSSYARAIAFKYGSTSYTNILSTTNNNLYYAGNPGTKNLIFENSASTGYQTLAAYQGVMTGRETVSQTGDITFATSTTGELKFTNIYANRFVFNTGTPISGISTDFYGNPRDTETPSGNNNPDMGAYEFQQSLGLEEAQIPTTNSLSQNYPNPFNPETTIKFALANEAQVNLTVYNAKGEIVKTLVNSNMKAGNHSANFNAIDLNSGVYFYKLTTPTNSFVQKMIMLK